MRTLTPDADPRAALRIPGRDIYRFAHLCGAVGVELLEQATPREDVDDLLHALFPTLDRGQRDRLWDRGRMDAAGLSQAERHDTWSWPLADMGAPDARNRDAFGAFLCELESSVEGWIREAHQ